MGVESILPTNTKKGSTATNKTNDEVHTSDDPTSEKKYMIVWTQMDLSQAKKMNELDKLFISKLKTIYIVKLF